MSTRAERTNPPAAYRTARTAPAAVTQLHGPGHARACFREGDEASARVAVPGYAPAVGDRVLVTVDDAGDAWIVGVIEAAPPTPLLDAALAEGPPGLETIRDRDGRLLFEYDPAANRAVLHVPQGDLELVVPAGALRMRARDGVAIESAQDLALRAERAVEVSAAGATAAESRLRLQAGEVSIVGSVLTAAADRAELLAKRAGLHAHTVETQAKRARHVVDVLEVRAGRIVERAKDVYREVERLSQTRAGRLRMVAKTAAELVGENTLLKARDRMKVKGERIHLA